MIAVHLLAASVWVGALLHVLRVARWRHTHGEPAAPLVRAYARLALILFVVVLTAGTVSALTLIDLDQLIGVLRDTGYGHWLLAKLTLLALVAGLASWARWHLGRRPARRQPASAARVEAVALVAILGVSGTLTALAPPAQTNIPLPFPPPAVGPVEALGSRACWIGVGVSASSGQLLVRLTTPDTHNELDEVEADDTEHYELAGNIADATSTGTATNTGTSDTTRLAFRRCGTGCFVAPVNWTNGHHTVTLRTSSQHWDGGTTALTVVWPARQAPALLRRVVRVMQTVEQVTVHEQVTSNTNSGRGGQHSFRMTGGKFLRVGPYGSGIASTAVVLKDTTSETTLAIGYPAEGTYLLLTLDQSDRIVHEVQASPNHLVSRSLVYPESEEEEDHEHEH